MPDSCWYRRRLSRCQLVPIATCQFCGRRFCGIHGTRHEDGTEVCARPVCVEKNADLRSHLVWRARAIDRSNRGFCGMDGCNGVRWGQCSKCHALFCERHLHDRDDRVRAGSIVFSRPASMCDHCAARNRLWSRA